MIGKGFAESKEDFKEEGHELLQDIEVRSRLDWGGPLFYGGNPAFNRAARQMHDISHM